MDCPAGKSHNICPPASWRSSQGLDAIICGTATISLGILCVCHTLRHVALPDDAFALFGCPTFTSLRRLCSHNYTFDFPYNHRFSYRVPHLEGGHFNFLESRPLTRWVLTVRLSWVGTLKFGQLDKELRSCSHITLMCHMHCNY